MARRADATAERRVRLSKDRVLRAAIGLADRGGIGSLTMRRLAHELGVEAMSPYHYVDGKDDILKGIVAIVVSEIDLPAGGADWKAAIRRSAISFHDALSRHPWAASLLMSAHGIGPARVRYIEALLRRLREAGFSTDLTDQAYHALDSHILGSTLWAEGYTAVVKDHDFARTLPRQFPVDDYPYFWEHAREHATKAGSGGKSVFEFGLDLILDGLEDGLEKIHAAAPRGSVSTPRRRNGSKPAAPRLE